MTTTQSPEEKERRMGYVDFHGRAGTAEEVIARNNQELLDSRRRHHDPNCQEPNCQYAKPERAAELHRLEREVIEAAKAHYNTPAEFNLLEATKALISFESKEATVQPPE